MVKVKQLHRHSSIEATYRLATALAQEHTCRGVGDEVEIRR